MSTVTYISNFMPENVDKVEEALSLLSRGEQAKFEICQWPMPPDGDLDYDYDSALRAGLWCVMSRGNRELNNRFFGIWVLL